MKKFLYIPALVFLLSPVLVWAYEVPIECPVPFSQSDKDLLLENTKVLDKAIKDGDSEIDSTIASLENGTFQFVGNDQQQIDTLAAKYDGLIASQRLANQSYEGQVMLSLNRIGINQQNPQEYQAEIDQARQSGQARIASIENSKNTNIADLKNTLANIKIQQLVSLKEKSASQQEEPMNNLIGTLKCPITNPQKPEAVSKAVTVHTVVAPVVQQNIVPVPVTETAPPQSKVSIFKRIGNYLKGLFHFK